MKKQTSVKVKFYTVLKDKLGVSEERFVGVDNVKDVLDKLSQKYGEVFKTEIFDENGNIHNYYILLLNEKTVDQKNPQRFKIKDGDVLHIFPPIAGG